jgi:hypothetical protein
VSPAFRAILVLIVVQSAAFLKLVCMEPATKSAVSVTARKGTVVPNVKSATPGTTTRKTMRLPLSAREISLHRAQTLPTVLTCIMGATARDAPG